MTTTELLKTPLFDWHAAHGGRMVDFAGWSMPVQYTSIVAEHNATRTAATLFDVSHMGRFRFTGPGAQSFLDGLATRRVSDLQTGQVRYSLITNDQGGILDDVLIYHLPHAEGGTYFGMVVNASNREKIVRWIDDHLGDRGDVRFTDVTLATAMIAVQGPRALELLQPHIQFDLASMKYYHAVELSVQEKTTVVSRTGYTGEDGFELIVPASIAADLWEKLINDGESIGVQPAGLGARDTLRLEAGMPLYGHELTEETTPLEAGLGFAVNLEDRNFPGADALRAIKQRWPQANPHRPGTFRQARRARTLWNFRRRPAHRRSHQRHFFTDAAKTDRHGLRSAATKPARHRIVDRHPRLAGTGPCGKVTVLQTSHLIHPTAETEF